MAVSLGEAILKIGADSSTFERKLMRLKGLAKHHMDAAASAVLRSAKNLMLAGAGAIAAGAAGIIKSTLDAAAFGDAMSEMSERTGMTVKALSELKYAAGLTGGSVEDIEKATKKMARTIDDMRDGMKAAEDSFKKLNLTAKDFKGLNVDQTFDLVARRIADIKDPLERAALAQEIFGRSGTTLLPMLSGGADGLRKMREEANRLGLVMSEKDAQAAAELQDNIDRLKGSLAGLKLTIGSQLIPALDSYVKKATEWITANRQLIATKIEEVVKRVAIFIKEWGPPLMESAKWLAEHAKTLGIVYLSIVGIATMWKVATAAVTAYKAASVLVGMPDQLAAERAKKAAAEAAKTGGAAAAGSAAGKAGKIGLAIGLAGTLGWGLAGGAAAGAGLGVGTLANEHLGIRKGWLWAAGWDRKDKRADAPITQADIAASRAQAQSSAGGTTINISNLSVNADDVVTAKNFQNMLTQKAHAAMP